MTKSILDSKQCSSCRFIWVDEELIKQNFWKNASRPDGYTTYCKFCSKFRENKPKVPSYLIPFESSLVQYAQRQVFYMVCRKELPRATDCTCRFCEEKGFKYAHWHFEIPEDTFPLCRDHYNYYMYLALQDGRIPEV